MIKLPTEHQATLGLDFNLHVLDQLRPSVEGQPLLNPNNYSEPAGFRAYNTYLHHPSRSFHPDQLQLVQMATVIADGYHTDLAFIIHTLIQQLIQTDTQTLTWTPSQPFDSTAGLDYQIPELDDLLRPCLLGPTELSSTTAYGLSDMWNDLHWTPNPVLLALCWQLVCHGSIKLKLSTDPNRQQRLRRYRQTTRQRLQHAKQLKNFPVEKDLNLTVLQPSQDPHWREKLAQLPDEGVDQ